LLTSSREIGYTHRLATLEQSEFDKIWNWEDYSLLRRSRLESKPTVDAVLIEASGPVYGREAIEKHYKDLFQNVHFSNNHTMYNDPSSNSPHAIGTDGNEMWENGEWSTTWQVKGGDPEQHSGYHASIAVREGGVWKKRMVITNITPAPAK
jgi:hypothetical protein